MILQAIFTLDGERPILDQYEFDKQALKDEGSFKKFLLSKIPMSLHEKVIKVKCSLHSDSELERMTTQVPQWYKDADAVIRFK